MKILLNDSIPVAITRRPITELEPDLNRRQLLNEGLFGYLYHAHPVKAEIPDQKHAIRSQRIRLSWLVYWVAVIQEWLPMISNCFIIIMILI
jgi:hypothetical protein